MHIRLTMLNNSAVPNRMTATITCSALPLPFPQLGHSECSFRTPQSWAVATSATQELTEEPFAVQVGDLRDQPARQA